MKIFWNRKYTTIAVYILIIALIAISYYLGITKFSILTQTTNTIIVILRPFIVGFALAYLINFILVFYEERLLKKLVKKNIKFKVKRALSLILTYITVGIILMLFFKFVLPQVTDSITRIITDFPKIVNKLYGFADDFIYRIDMPTSTKIMINQKIIELGRNLMDFVTNLMPFFANFFLNILKGIWNTVLGIIISIYILADKEGFLAMFRKFTAAVFSKKQCESLYHITGISNDIFGKFIIGKIIDSCIIAFITFIVLSITGMPYRSLVTFIIGVTNVIPFFGPFIGAIPSVLIVLMVDPIKALWLVLIIFIIQQLDGNVIGPKILGNSIGISSFWILFSLLIGGKLIGILGMVIGVPIFAIIHTIVTESVNDKLIKKGLPTDKKEYM